MFAVSFLLQIVDCWRVQVPKYDDFHEAFMKAESKLSRRHQLHDIRRWRETRRHKFTPKQKKWQKMRRDIIVYKKVGHSVTFVYCLNDSVKC